MIAVIVSIGGPFRNPFELPSFEARPRGAGLPSRRGPHNIRFGPFHKWPDRKRSAGDGGVEIRFVDFSIGFGRARRAGMRVLALGRSERASTMNGARVF